MFCKTFPSVLSGPQKNLRCAFTLVELLIALGIIAALAALLFPVFNGAKKRSQTATCASNLKQIGQAIEMYVNDNRGFYPRIWNFPSNDNSPCSKWVERIYPYVRKTQIFECPAAPEGLTYELGCPPDAPGVGTIWVTTFDGAYDLNSPMPDNFFRLNPHPSGLLQPSMGYANKALHQVDYRRPGSTILVLDGDGYFVNPAREDPPYEGVEGLKKCGVDAWHNNGANVCFADGHVKWMSLQSLTKRSLWTLGGPE